MLKNYLVVALGAFFGTLTRYVANESITTFNPEVLLLIINLFACLVFALAAPLKSNLTKLLITTGFSSSLSSYSAFVELLSDNLNLLKIVWGMLQLILGITVFILASIIGTYFKSNRNR